MFFFKFPLILQIKKMYNNDTFLHFLKKSYSDIILINSSRIHMFLFNSKSCIMKIGIINLKIKTVYFEVCTYFKKQPCRFETPLVEKKRNFQDRRSFQILWLTVWFKIYRSVGKHETEDRDMKIGSPTSGDKTLVRQKILFKYMSHVSVSKSKKRERKAH